MPLPNDFSPAEHLQDLIRRTMNQEVREWFADLGDTWTADISTPRSSLRVGCTHMENDTVDMTVLRTLLFYFLVGQAEAATPPFYGIPSDAFQQAVTFLPQVKLFFYEDLSDVEPGYQPVTAELTYRLVGETSESMTTAKATVIANRIKTEFCSGGGFRFHKGKTKVQYEDKAKGYLLRINCFSVEEGKRVINKVLDLNNDSPNWDNLIHSQYENAPPALPPTKHIYGKSRRMPRKRPVAWVRFRWAELHLWGLPRPINLIDRLNVRRNTLVRA